MAGALAAVLASAGSFADDPAALLKRGTAAMKTGDYETACPALAESFRLAPSPISAFQSATCEAHAGRFKTAVERYGKFLELVESLPAREKKQHNDRIEVATKQRADLAPLVPAVTLTLPAGTPDGTVVLVDGRPIDRSQMGTPFELDPGEHVFTTQPPGREVRERRITLTASEKAKVALEVDLPPPEAPPAPAPVAPPAAPEHPPPEEPSSVRRPLAYGAIALGVLGLAGGVVAGVLSMQRKQVVDENCNEGKCNGEGKDAADTGLLLAHLSTIGFGVGALGLGGGLLLILTEPSGERQAIVPRVNVAVTGRW